MRNYFGFVSKYSLAHVVTYMIVGAIAYPLLTKEFYMGANPIFSSFMITENDRELWNIVLIWILPGQILRGLLIGSVIFPFYRTLNEWNYGKRFLALSGLYIVIGFWASAVAAPGTIDGIIYMRPEITWIAHLKFQIEIIIQGLLLSAWMAKWMNKKKAVPNLS